jgi:hypothetical protein
MLEEEQTRMAAGSPETWKKGSKMIVRMKRKTLCLVEDKEGRYLDEANYARLCRGGLFRHGIYTLSGITLNEAKDICSPTLNMEVLLL